MCVHVGRILHGCWLACTLWSCICERLCMRAVECVCMSAVHVCARWADPARMLAGMYAVELHIWGQLHLRTCVFVFVCVRACVCVCVCVCVCLQVSDTCSAAERLKVGGQLPAGRSWTCACSSEAVAVRCLFTLAVDGTDAERSRKCAGGWLWWVVGGWGVVGRFVCASKCDMTPTPTPHTSAHARASIAAHAVAVSSQPPTQGEASRTAAERACTEGCGIAPARSFRVTTATHPRRCRTQYVHCFRRRLLPPLWRLPLPRSTASLSTLLDALGNSELVPFSFVFFHFPPESSFIVCFSRSGPDHSLQRNVWLAVSLLRVAHVQSLTRRTHDSLSRQTIAVLFVVAPANPDTPPKVSDRNK
jgi:hypothetical protein